ncbi:hypothetical protein [Mycobacterium vicinigordonae]|uniref:Uncharacterized protein n=1 Tax=Mycobacterium vicinigordonae TaxID=1719132 RepID=A0A7D6I9F3_9MYCO|nr:hypothetical protein [Mycobacterium vicinigordonae]QLL07937.1 hypothetical protein H0P51_02785 [Mycobacterium vicinigordonae]
MNRALAGVDLLIGIDDTDDLSSPGTGRRARSLLRELADAGLGSSAGATRHQLLVDDRIPYTSHNSSACLAWRSTGGQPQEVLAEVAQVAGRFLERVCPPDADPGLAVVAPDHLCDPMALIDFGYRAKREVLCAHDARALATALGLHLSGHGGTQDGVLGALAAVGLHLSGNDGLFITLPGLYELPHVATVGEIYDRIPLDDARDGDNRRPARDELVELGDWVHPVLLGGRSVLLLEPPRESRDGRVWRAAARAVVKQH